MHQSERKLIIIRHAERPAITDGTVGDELSLTEKGKADTLVYAENFNSEVISIRTSPIARCVQTAQIMANHWGYPPDEIQTCNKLGDPGFFISDSELAWQNWLEKGAEAVNQYLLGGNEKWPGFVDFDMAIIEMQSWIRSTLLSSRSGSHVWVTHDTILATLASRLSPNPLSLEEWPGFLGRLEVSLAENESIEFQYFPVIDRPQK